MTGPGTMDTGYRILRGGSVHGPDGRKTAWWVRVHDRAETVWGRGGNSGWRLVGNAFFDPRGAQSSYFVVEDGDARTIHGPDEKLPWA
jgi:hypothetical protein